MENMRFKLERLTDEERIIRDQIASVLRTPNQTISALDLAKRIYNDSMKSNELLKNDLTAQLAPLEKILSTRIYERDEALEKYELTFKTFQECH
jgi:hypothetical protein